MRIERGFTAVHAETLRTQTFDDFSPSPIVHDFQVLLDRIGSEGVKAAGQYNLLPLDAIPVLDEQLARPLRLQMKRPQLRSHPYLQGLHLLLRASGITCVQGSGAKTRLVVELVQRLEQAGTRFHGLCGGIECGGHLLQLRFSEWAALHAQPQSELQVFHRPHDLRVVSGEVRGPRP